MKLPELITSQTQSQSINDLENIARLRELFNQFSNKMQKVTEIRIYLKNSFHKSDINDSFISDLENEYAVQFLTKMDLLPTKEHREKLLRLRPIDQCDFHMSTENITSVGSERIMKCVHIYPNHNKCDSRTKQLSKVNTTMITQKRLNQMLSNEDFEAAMNHNSILIHKQDPITMIKQRLIPIKKEDITLFKRDIVDNNINKAKDDILDKQLYSHNNETNDIKTLSIENIRENYINPTKTILNNSKSVDVTKAKFRNITKANKRDIINDPKYEFNILDIGSINKEIIEEVIKPVDLPIEIIMKDVNFILDNFPIEDLIDFNSNSNDKTLIRYSQQLYNRIKSISKQDITLVYNKIQSKEVYRVIGLTINLIYWIVFGKINRIQLDQATKHYLYIKLLKQIELLSEQQPCINHRLYLKAFLPFLIIVIRYECQTVFIRKFKLLLDKEEYKQKAMEKINEVITVIYDPNSYYNTFTLMGGNLNVMKHRMSKEIIPRYKEKCYVTSNMVDQLFGKFENERYCGTECELDVGKQKEFIKEAKLGFYKDMLVKMNGRLKRRNLEPIFEVVKDKKIDKEINKEIGVLTVPY